MRKRIEIAGMTPETYDADKDPRGDIGHALADAVMRDRDNFAEDLFPLEVSNQPRSNFDYQGFQSAVASSRIPVGDIFSHRTEKEKLLREYGYTHGIVAGGKRVPLSELGDPRIGNMFRKTYRQSFALRNRL